MSESAATDLRRRLGDERGFIIVEVLVSAVILVTVSLAVFLTLEKADGAAGNQQKRTLAANYAQSELERIRSLPVEDIAALRGERKVTRDGIEYTINVVAKWVTDGSDEPDCTTKNSGLDYMRTTVTIQWEGMAKAKAVSMTSLFTPAPGAGGGNTGSASVHLTNRLGAPVKDVTIYLDGPQDFQETTNANGCVVFGFVPASTSYHVKFSSGNFVNAQSVKSVDDLVTVTGGQTTKLAYDYDQGGYTSASFWTRVNGVEQPTAPRRVQLFNAAQPDGAVGFDLSGTQTSWDGSAIPLFPFTSPYAIYAGNCEANIIPSTNPDSKFVNITPGAFQNAGKVYMPSYSIEVRDGFNISNPGNAVANAKVAFDPGCTPIYDTRVTGSNGKIADTGFPYSAAPTICAMSASRRVAIAGKPNIDLVNGVGSVLYLQGTGSKSGGYSGAGSVSSCFA